MSLGFEVELKVELENKGASFPEQYKGVTLFRTQARPGVCAVIETGTTGLAATLVELVTQVDINPYVREPHWLAQVDQLVQVAGALARCKAGSTVKSFVEGTAAVKLSKRTSKDINARMGSFEVSVFRQLLCCWPAQDERVEGVRVAQLYPKGSIVRADCVQVNFSTNLAYLGGRLRQGQHPFEQLLDSDHLKEEQELVKTMRRANLRAKLRLEEPSDALLGFLFLVLHRLTFETHRYSPGKNRFLFLPRFDLLDIKARCLDGEDRQQLGELDLDAVHKLVPKNAHLPAKSAVFSKAYAQMKKPGPQVVQNTVAEFLGAVLYDDYGKASQKQISEYVMRVPDSTIPQKVEGAENIVFEGRLDAWTQFADKAGDFADASIDGELDMLRQALTQLGNIVMGYDQAPRPQMVALDIQEADMSGHDGMRVPLL